ncbi:hypothetical protein VTI28DRAFT_9504 [Corynascus sepedonium]
MVVQLMRRMRVLLRGIRRSVGQTFHNPSLKNSRVASTEKPSEPERERSCVLSVERPTTANAALPECPQKDATRTSGVSRQVKSNDHSCGLHATIDLPDGRYGRSLVGVGESSVECGLCTRQMHQVFVCFLWSSPTRNASTSGRECRPSRVVGPAAAIWGCQDATC